MLYYLADELLVHIFQYLDINELCTLRSVCGKFKEIVDYKCYAICGVRNGDLITTRQDTEKIIKRSVRKLSRFEKYRIYHNWKSGKYQRYSLLYEKQNYMPWLHLERDLLWISRGHLIKAYDRKESTGKVDASKPRFIVAATDNNDICRYVIKDNLLLSGQVLGSMMLWSIEHQKFIFHLTECHLSDIEDVDFYQDLVVSGSRDDSVKIWPGIVENPIAGLERVQKIDMKDRVWSVALNKDEQVAIGTAGIKSPPITIYDIRRSEIVASFNAPGGQVGAGVKEIKWESPQIIWTCGYDSYVRKWDLRMNTYVHSIQDSFGSTIYCFDTDFQRSVLTGSENYGRIILWDVRRDNPVQIYFLQSSEKHKSSPVYSLSYEPTLLFAATSRHLNVLDFRTHSGKTKNYSRILFSKSRRPSIS